MKRYWFLTVSLFVGLGCAGKGELEAYADNLDWAEIELVKSEIEGIVRSTPDCEKEPRHENCQTIEVSALQSIYNWDHYQGEKILVIENDFMVLPTLGRYRNRMK